MFKKGDKVICIRSYEGQITKGKTYIVRTSSNYWTIIELDDTGNANGWWTKNFVKYSDVAIILYGED
jgi:hypothetical protein